MNNYAHIFDLLTRLRQVNDNFLEKTIVVVYYHFKSVLISLIKKKKKSINFRALLCCFVSILPVYLQLIFIIYKKKSIYSMDKYIKSGPCINYVYP